MRLYSFSALLIILLSFTKSSATHIIGGEIGYTHLSNYTYEVKLTLYGDCGGNAFSGLPNSVPRVEIWKDNVPNSFVDLTLTSPGFEVTPVCPSEVNNTTCVNSTGTIPGVMRFIYTGTIDLGGLAAEWAFIFGGRLGGNSGAGRTNAITNISANSAMALKATLNNMNGPNNSAIFTTIPTPFFCINQSQQYNQGGFDPDGHQLNFALVPGLSADNSGNLVGNVSYNFPYTYLNPLAVLPGSFIFNTISGQMSFTPNMVQTSLVVNKITETQGGVVVGTTMREMNLVVLNNCNNQPPQASIPVSTIGTFDTNRVITLCNKDLNPVFTIDINDPDNQAVNVTVSGLPSGVNHTVTGNGTATPVVIINWTIPQPTVPGVYNFYVSCEDAGCPLTSNQTFALTLNIIQPISNPIFNNASESCVPGADGAISINTFSTNGGITFSLNGGLFQSSNNYSGLTSNNYTILIKDAEGCTRVAQTNVLAFPKPTASFQVEPESCLPANDGSITIVANSVNGGITQYNLNNGPGQSSPLFSNLNAGVYTVVVTDIAGCTVQGIITIPQPIRPTITGLSIQEITCQGKSDGMVQTSITPAGMNLTYTLEPGNMVNTSGRFENLDIGNYTITVTNDKQCSDTAYVTLTEPEAVLITDLEIDEATCDKNNATIRVSSNKNPPLIYSLYPAIMINNDGIFNDVAPGYYTVNVRDSNFCEVDSLIYVGARPNLFSSSITHKDLPCWGSGFEGEAEVFVSGGIEPYTYLWSSAPAQSTPKASGLYYGWYFVHVSDATGCELNDTVYIQPGTCCENVFIPNAFTPNGDGQNDEWNLASSTGMEIAQFAVYNRWGEKIWTTRDQLAKWNGTFKGNDVPNGSYFYLLRYKCLSDGKWYTRKGDITVLK